MSFGEYLEFAFFFGFLALWCTMSYLGTFKTERILKTFWGKSIWRNAAPQQVKWVSTIFFLAGLLFLIFSAWQLSTGTFKWKGKPKTYSFSDFLK